VNITFKFANTYRVTVIAAGKQLMRQTSPRRGRSVSLGPHGAYFRMRQLKSQVAKVSLYINFRMRKYAQCGPRLTGY